MSNGDHREDFGIKEKDDHNNAVLSSETNKKSVENVPNVTDEKFVSKGDTPNVLESGDQSILKNPLEQSISMANVPNTTEVDDQLILKDSPSKLSVNMGDVANTPKADDQTIHKDFPSERSVTVGEIANIPETAGQSIFRDSPSVQSITVGDTANTTETGDQSVLQYPSSQIDESAVSLSEETGTNSSNIGIQSEVSVKLPSQNDNRDSDMQDVKGLPKEDSIIDDERDSYKEPLTEEAEESSNTELVTSLNLNDITEHSMEVYTKVNDTTDKKSDENLAKVDTINKDLVEDVSCEINHENSIETFDAATGKSLTEHTDITDTAINKKNNENKDLIDEIQMEIDISVAEENKADEKNKDNIDTIDDKPEEDIASTSDHDTSLEHSTIEVNKDHGLNKPDFMIEIPSQELIDFDDDSADLTNTLYLSPDVEKTSPSPNPTILMEEDDIKLQTTEANDIEKEETIINLPRNGSENTNHNEDVDVIKKLETETVKSDINSESTSKILPDKDLKVDDITNIVEVPGKVFLFEEGNKTECTSNIAEVPEKEIIITEETSKKEIDVVPTTSAMEQSTEMAPDASDEVPEVTDSLGLLAESSRVVEDDEEQEDDDDGDDEEDFDPDDESNQMTGENSEDSNPQQSETELPSEQTYMDTENAQEYTEDKDTDTLVENNKDNTEFSFEISSVFSERVTNEDKDADMEIDRNICQKVVETPDDEGTTRNKDEGVQAVDIKIVEDSTIETLADNKKDIPIEPVENQAMDIENVKLPDTSDNETKTDGGTQKSILKDLLKGYHIDENTTPAKELTPPKEKEEKEKSPSKTKKLEISQPKHVLNIVDLEESSSEDDLQEVKKDSEPETDVAEADADVGNTDGMTSVNIPKDIDIMCTSAGSPSDIVAKDKEMVISGLPKPPPHKPTRLNTDEVTIKTAFTASESTLVIPETKLEENVQGKDNKRPLQGLEIFSLDSDEEDSTIDKGGDLMLLPTDSNLPSPKKPTETATPRETNRCVNYSCKSDSSDSTVQYYVADRSVIAFYDATRKKRTMVCQNCAEAVARRAQGLVEGVKNFTPLLDLDMKKLSEDLVEISDSESEDESEAPEEPKETIGVEAATSMEAMLADMINATWQKFKMDARLRDTEDFLNKELQHLEKESKEIDDLLNECQTATDNLRNELYATFEPERVELAPLIIHDMPGMKFSCLEEAETECRQSKRRMSSASEIPAKRPAIPLGYTPLESESQQIAKDQETETAPNTVEASNKIDEDNVDISVVKLSAEAAPPDLPPPGEVTRAPLRCGMTVYAMRNSFGSWMRARIIECHPKGSTIMASQFTMCRVRFENTKNQFKTLPGRCLAYSDPADVRLIIGTRVIALFKDKKELYYSGVIAEMPNPVNSYRYLVFFDDGYAQYVSHSHTRLVCECSPLVWEEVHPFSRQFVREYLRSYPERPMVRLHPGQSLKTEWNGKWWVSRVIQVDASLVQVQFEVDGRAEWIYRGSTRLAPLYLELQAAERHRSRPLPRSTSNKAQPKSNMPYVEYTRSDEQASSKDGEQQTQQQQSEEIRRQRAVAKKSTVTSSLPPPQPQVANLDSVTSRVVYYTPKNAVRPYKMVPHTCSPKCKRSDVLALKDLRTYNPLAKPLLSGWERQIVRYKGQKEVMYRAPCGRRVRDMRELHRYLRTVHSDMAVDLFDFGPNTHCLAEFVLNKCLVSKKDLSHGKENVPVPCVNYYDASLPEFCSYNTERTPTAGVPLNIDPDFLCGCDCTDDCEDKSKCACWKMTLEGARTIGLEGEDLGYVYKRLPEPLPSGIYECNIRCKCKQTCLNRVAQHPLQLKLQVFKTLNRGWGIRALNDVPKGSFLCVYAGNLLTDATANLDGLNEGDEYLAELDYIEVVEQMKEGYEEDIPDVDKELDKKDSAKSNDADEPEDESTASEDEDDQSRNDDKDDDFKPGYVGQDFTEFNKRLRKRDKNKIDQENTAGNEKESEKEKEKEKTKDANAEEDCITISDDEEVREPSRFMAQAGMGANEFVPKHRSVRAHFGKDEACYIMDAKVQGNIGRYLNHSCSPNVFVQNVFVDTHDPRFPWVAFFALCHIRAGTELTWNYNYDVGSVPGKVLYCYCGAPNCRGRLL